MAASGQYFSNPSFEGETGIGVSPPSWIPLDEFSTPDTEPLSCDPYPASDGNTYLTLVIRGADHLHPHTNEMVSTLLLQPLNAVSYYKLTVDLASRDDVGHFSWEEGFVAYRAPVILRVYGSNSGTTKGVLLSESKTVTSSEWNHYSLILYPQVVMDYLVLEVGSSDSSEGMGNLLVDLITLEEIDEPPLDYGELKVPNTFTPNGDGANDQFMIRGLPERSRLIVYDRLGRIVFESLDYKQDWGGTDLEGKILPSDTYWYHLFPSGMNEAVKGFVYLKRE